MPVASGCVHEKGESQLVWLQSSMEGEFPDRDAPLALDPSRQAEPRKVAQEAATAPTTVAQAPADSPAAAGPATTASGEPASGTAVDDGVIRIEVSGKMAGTGPGPATGIHVTFPPEPSGVSEVPVAAAGASSPATDPTPKREYERGLALVRAHDFDRALATFSTYLARWPDLPGAEGAMYWSAECYLAKGELLAASEAFESTHGRFPHGAMAPDSLLKLGVCAQRLGREDKAKAYYGRLALEFPKSDATRRIPRDHAAPL